MRVARATRAGWLLAGALALAGCDQLMPVTAERPESALEFPKPDRPVAKVVSTQFANEDARDERDEAHHMHWLFRSAGWDWPLLRKVVDLLEGLEDQTE